MAKYRKKPVVIEAVRFTEEFRDGAPDWLIDALKLNTSPGGLRADTAGGRLILRVYTLEGVMVAEPGDWIIRGVKGELYPCKPEIFAATYEAVDEPV